MKKMKRILCLVLAFVMLASTAVMFSGCSDAAGGDTTNTLCLYPINYYGIAGRGFTYRWDGMKAALADYGWTVTGDGQKDSLKFKVERTDDGKYTTPADTQIIFINNQTWDTGLALTEPLSEYAPLAVISTCNGVEFCSQQISSWSPSTNNATMAGFSANYEEAFKNGTLHYVAAKYSASVAPVVGLLYNAIVTGKRLENENGEAPNLSQDYWHITSYEQYQEASQYDNVGSGDSNPTIMKADMDAVLPYNNPNATYADFVSFVEKTATYEGVQGLYNGNREVQDTVITDRKVKIGLLVPSSINESVQAYIDYMEKYAAEVYNIEFVRYPVSGTISQVQACNQACDAGCEGVISLQDDTDRVSAIKTANSRGVFFAVAGTCVGDVTYEDTDGNQFESEYSQTKDLPYYVGAVGCSLESDYRAAYEMTAYYLQLICERGEQ